MTTLKTYNLNLRVQKFDANRNLLKTKEQYSYDMGIFDDGYPLDYGTY
jgi:hypothetical protein